MLRTVRRRTLTPLIALLVALVLLPCACPSRALAEVETRTLARPSTTGQLHVEGTSLAGSDGTPVVLQGVSTHGIQWFPEFVNERLFGQLSREWDCNVMRLALYSDDYCKHKLSRSEKLSVIYRGIEACIANDQYVIVDWHVLDEGNPNVHLEEAQEFFEEISRAYANVPNVIFEICNEPNGEVTWSEIRSYAKQVIPVIRANSPQAIVVVGTPNFDRELAYAVRDPVPFGNVMYALHFYAASHDADLRTELTHALDSGLPVIVSECGISEANGDGSIDCDSATAWFDLLHVYNVSYTVWSLSDKQETSALLRSTYDHNELMRDKDLTPTGLWIKSLLQGVPPAEIERPDIDASGTPIDSYPRWMRSLDAQGLRSAMAWKSLAKAVVVFMLLGILVWYAYFRYLSRRPRTYDDLLRATGRMSSKHGTGKIGVLRNLAIVTSSFFTLVYLAWRMCFSIPVEYGWLSIAFCVILLVVEVFGFFESIIHYASMVAIHKHPLPKIADEDYPEVDIFVATYNEPVDLLRRTINGCCHLRYPDKSKVHVWVCDDNRRPAMRELAESMGVGYFDRPDNEGSKAGNLNHAMSLTSAPYVVTLDADMIPRSDFLLKTVPYFVDAEQLSATLPAEKAVRLGLLQTPQAFYDPDVFQHALYAEHHVPNEQDFFYRSIEVAKTTTNSVIYGGSNTVLSRAALEAVGGFYTKSITEDFATGLLIESNGFVSLGLGEPLASGRTPDTYAEHIQQRTRWGRGVIATARQLGVWRRPGLTFIQRVSYWSSVTYWYSALKNLIYICSPLVFATLGVPVFKCSWLDLYLYWLPMFVCQTLCLRIVSGNVMSAKWSGIYETSVMPKLLVPIIKESLGISMSVFKVTDKSQKSTARTHDRRAMRPFIVLLVLSAIGVARIAWMLSKTFTIGLIVLLFWLIRNAYYLVMSLFLVDGRDSDGETVKVRDVLWATVEPRGGTVCEAVTTRLTEHSVQLFVDEGDAVRLGDRVDLRLDSDDYHVDLEGVVIRKVEQRAGDAAVATVEILDFGGCELEYWQILYDRIPSLPQTLRRDRDVLRDLWVNIACRIARTTD